MPRAGPSPVLSDILLRGKNNFDLIRLIAAVTVIFGHSFYVFPTGGFQEPVTMLIQNNFSGTLAVGTFFFLSGILVTQSFVRSASPGRYLLMRAARIYPGAIVCLLVLTIGIGAIATTHSLGSYLSDPALHCYVISNWSLTRLEPSSGHCNSLPGVFETNHIGRGPNGSLWTLTPEIVCYAYVLAFGLIGALKNRGRILVSLGLLLTWHALAPSTMPYFSDDHYTDELKVALFFMAGVAAYAWRDALVIRGRYAAALVVVAALLQGTAVQEYALYMALYYLVLLAAASPHLRWRLPGDWSFGVYIYGWPIQQLVNHLFPELTSYPSNLLCIPVALFAGYLSWTWVERPMLVAAHRLASPPPAAASSEVR